MMESLDFEDIERDVRDLHYVEGLTPNDLDVRNLGSLASRLVNQLVNGCRNSECRNTLCFTGRSNTSKAPCRKYTVRSAKIITLSLLFQANIDTKLCTTRTDNVHDDSLKDPSSFEQQLVDTDVIQRLMTAKSFNVGNQAQIHVRTRTERFRGMLEYITRPPYCPDGSQNPGFISNSLAAYHTLIVIRYIITHMADLGVTAHDRKAYDAQRTVTNSMTHSHGHILLKDVCNALSYRLKLDRFIGAATQDSVGYLLSLHLDTAYAENGCREEDKWRMFIFVHILELVMYVDWDIQPLIQKNSVAYAALGLLNKFNTVPDDVNPQSTWLQGTFVGSLSEITVAESYLDHEEATGDHSVHILEYSFLFGERALSRMFQIINHMRMSRSHATRSIIAGNYHEFFCEANMPLHDLAAESKIKDIRQRFLLLRVRRDHVMQDAFSQLWQRQALELHKPLRVRIVEIDGFAMGQDLGGVQIEFFNILMNAIMQEDAGMFTTNETGFAYFKPGSLQPLHMFEHVGILMGLAVFNGIALPVRLPLVLYHIIMRKSYSPEHLQDRWKSEVASLEKMKHADVTDWQLPYEFNLAANGVQLTISPAVLVGAETPLKLTVIDAKSSDRMADVDLNGVSWPGWEVLQSSMESKLINDDNKVQFSQDYTHWLAERSVQPQLNAFLQGFQRVMHPYTIKMLHHPHLLREIVEGSDNVNVESLRKWTSYDSFDESEEYIETFWRLLEAWPAERRKALVRFITAAERMPKAGNLWIRISRVETDDEQRLPTSSTCFSTLYLPVYDSEEVLEKNLITAIDFGEYGFGIG